MPFFNTSDGARLRYEDTGQGDDVLLFVHGWCSRLEHWAPQAEYFASRCRVVRYDRRGHGESGATTGGYSPDQHAKDLGELVGQLGIARAVVVAHAGGGPTVLRFAARFPERVVALALLEANLYTADSQLQRTTPLMQAMRKPDYLTVFKAAYARFFSAASEPEMVARVVDEAARTPAPVILAELEGLVVDTVHWAREVTQPVLWIAAVPRAGETDGAGVAKVFAQPSYGQVVGAAHYPQMEVPDQVNAMLARFIRIIGGMGPGPA